MTEGTAVATAADPVAQADVAEGPINELSKAKRARASRAKCGVCGKVFEGENARAKLGSHKFKTGHTGVSAKASAASEHVAAFSEAVAALALIQAYEALPAHAKAFVMKQLTSKDSE